jgi:hypothetical protein
VIHALNAIHRDEIVFGTSRDENLGDANFLKTVNDVGAEKPRSTSYYDSLIWEAAHR